MEKSRQIIYYGAPGTGKSYIVDSIIKHSKKSVDSKKVEEAFSKFVNEKRYVDHIASLYVGIIYRLIMGWQYYKLSECVTIDEIESLRNKLSAKTGSNSEIIRFNQATQGSALSVVNNYLKFLKKNNEAFPVVETKSDKNYVRTTFHPDSDYSTFVGAYKPSMKNNDTTKCCKYEDLVDDFKTCLSEDPVNITNACTIFGYKYYNSIVEIQKLGHTIPELVKDAYKEGTTYDTQVRAGMALSKLNRNTSSNDSEIVYTFVPQVFLKAYLEAWKRLDSNNEEPYYLIIEEINRGNCAQIFGDLFQLLDRNIEGESCYSIVPDSEISKYIKGELSNCNNIPENIKNGIEMRLPRNFYIYATMNTSDQSLFPIDSAFKRRWDWEYEPIKYNHELKIKIGAITYKWTSFQKNVNKLIKDAFNSEDKMLGDYFVNPTDGVIDENMIRNKVLFYLWNDVCKDGEGDIFKTSDNTDITFSDLYGENGTETLITMMEYLKVEECEGTIDDEEQIDDEEESNHNRFALDGGNPDTLKNIVKQVVVNYAANNPQKNAQEIRDIFVDAYKGSSIAHIVETEDEFSKRKDQKSAERTVSKVNLPNGETVYVCTQLRAKNDGDNFFNFIRITKEKGWGEITPTKQAD
mgnify:FL=1